jgi:hypothetical protein
VNKQQFAQALLNDPNPANRLKLVDNYIDLFHKMGRQFILPQEHAELKQVVEEFASDLPAFVEYVRGIRDTVKPRSNAYISLHEVYRQLRVRQVQQDRRARGQAALVWFEKKYPKATTDQKMRWLRKLEQEWGKQRFIAMDTARAKLKSADRLTTGEREEVLDEFWKEIDDDIKQGNLPPL